MEPGVIRVLGDLIDIARQDCHMKNPGNLPVAKEGAVAFLSDVQKEGGKAVRARFWDAVDRAAKEKSG